MRKLFIFSVLLSFAVTSATPSLAFSKVQAATMRSAKLTCKSKIDPKGLKGQAKKDAWKACMEQGDSYN